MLISFRGDRGPPEENDTDFLQLAESQLSLPLLSKFKVASASKAQQTKSLFIFFSTMFSCLGLNDLNFQNKIQLDPVLSIFFVIIVIVSI